jgi:DNA-binding transcriptional LysR family regulator
LHLRPGANLVRDPAGEALPHVDARIAHQTVHLLDRQLGVSLVPDWAPPWPEALTLAKLPLPQPFDKRRVGVVWRRASARIRLVQALLAEARLPSISG